MKVTSESEVAQSCPTLATTWTAAYQAPPSRGFSRQEYWSGVPLPSTIHEARDGQNDPDCTSHVMSFLNTAVCFPPSTFSQQLTRSLNCTVPETSSGSMKFPVLILWKALSSACRNWRTDQSGCCHNAEGVIPRITDPSTKIKRKMCQRRKSVGTTSTPVFLPGESHGQRSLEGFGP